MLYTTWKYLLEGVEFVLRIHIQYGVPEASDVENPVTPTTGLPDTHEFREISGVFLVSRTLVKFGMFVVPLEPTTDTVKFVLLSEPDLPHHTIRTVLRVLLAGS
jgi:hypothetical protein